MTPNPCKPCTTIGASGIMALIRWANQHKQPRGWISNEELSEMLSGNDKHYAVTPVAPDDRLLYCDPAPTWISSTARPLRIQWIVFVCLCPPRESRINTAQSFVKIGHPPVTGTVLKATFSGCQRKSQACHFLEKAFLRLDAFSFRYSRSKGICRCQPGLGLL